MEFLSRSATETESFAEKFAGEISAPCVICLYGDLGAGKTAFTRGFARHFGIKKGVSSPTFIIMHCYNGSETINHYDLYRLTDYDELIDIGFEEQIEHGISLIEWPDNFTDFLPENRIEVIISRTADDEDTRLIRITDNRKDL